MYVREKRVGKYVYHQLVETYRDSGKVRQRVLAHLGKYSTLGEAIKGHRNSLRIYRELLNGNRSPGTRAMFARSAARHEKKLAELIQLQQGLGECSD